MASRTINTILNLRDRFTAPMRNIANRTRQQSRSMSVLRNNVQSFRQSAVSGFAAVAKHAALTATAVVGIQAAMDTVGGSIDFIKEYSSSMATFQAATGASTAELAKMEKSASDLYKKGLGENFNDVVSSMTLTKQVTGQIGDKLKKTTAMAVTYRDVFGEDITESLKASDTMAKQFGITSEQAYNLLAQGARKGLNKSGELIDSANEYSAYFAKLGFSAEGMFDVFASGMDAGAFALDKVGDGIKEFGIRTKDGSKASIDAYKAIGLNGKKMTQEFASGGKTAQKAFLTTVKAINAIKNPADRNAAAVALFGTQAEDLEDRVVRAYGNVKKQFDSTKNTMQEIGNIKYNNASQAFKGIGRNLEMLVLVPVAKRVLPKLNELGKWFTDNSANIESGVNKAFSVGAKVMDGFAKSVSWVKDNADWLLPVIAGLTGAFVAQQVVNKVTMMYKSFRAATAGITIAQAAMNLVMAANPFGIIAISIGAAVAVGILLWKNWDKIVAGGRRLGSSIVGIWGNIKTSIVSAVTQVGAWLNSFPLGQQFIGTITSVIGSVKLAFGGLTQFVKSVFAGDWQGAWDGIVQVFSNTFGLIPSYAKAPLNAIISLVNTVIDSVNGISIDIPSWVPGVGGNSFGVNIPRIPTFAHGTPYFKGGLAQINERGGEIVNLPNGSQVIPADKSEKMISNSRSAPVINIIIQGNVIGNEQFLDEVGMRVFGEVKLALGNM
ncbi:phage tail tape measure protein [Paenibacillus sp. MMS18-CY102]|uniref:phage tail tape measure protein n=1 Tax=Paenibacillus sp. MMS18-CY102 TaxID=2682849 RepID=UPI001365A1CB|nr:phage tail tape measure protein [Paenibacillus sp. MMS18-CY102]MWC26630.1 hypothetical protein [Paenibacillus sp. MMS18-CY102]